LIFLITFFALFFFAIFFLANIVFSCLKSFNDIL